MFAGATWEREKKKNRAPANIDAMHSDITL
jgi:hypothetical protein